ncbi:MAG: SpoIVB peptidase [Oscillospiraceae bacterium]|jgi:stage IV sporulation protein B|nr:SpoIVB peptidase [Oscillospiraceae bacterium]
MRGPIKRAAAFLTVCGMVYLSFIGYGMRALPGEMPVTGQQTVALGAPYTARVPEQPAEPVYQFLQVFPVKTAKITTAKRQFVLVGGDVFGIKLYTRGVLVAKTDMVTTQNGNENPAQAAGLRSGDVITEIDGKQVNRKSEVSRAIEESGGPPLRMTVERGGSVLRLECVPAESAAGGKYLAGLWLRDSTAGIGTVTFYDKESGTMAGLGHAICDVDSGEVIPISGGELVSARVMGCYKGADGAPGELCGVFEQEVLAALEINGDTGVYGEIGAGDIPDGGLLPVALKSEVKTGPAQIAVTVSGKEKQYYDVEITKVSSNLNAAQKNMTVRVTDPALIEATGGIVQGMSGSPVIQGGMLVGAVTHVFVNSSLEGYAIFAETMLETARAAAEERSNPGA